MGSEPDDDDLSGKKKKSDRPRDSRGRDKEGRRRKKHDDEDDNDREKRRERKKRGSDDDAEEDGKRDERRVKDKRRRRDDDEEEERRRPKRRKRDKKDDQDDDDDDSSESSGGSSRGRRKGRRRHKQKKKSGRKRKPSKKKSKGKRSRKDKKKEKRSSSDSSDDSDSSSGDDSSSSSSSDEGTSKKSKKVVVNEKLLAKLSARGETLEERKLRRAQKRGAKIEARFGYTAEENPFNDPNLHETFTWTKKKEKAGATAIDAENKGGGDTLEEIDNIRRRRKERDAERDEMDRLRAEESRMKELENYDEWAKKEEEFHLEQQRKRSAIRLVEGREKPVDILAKNLLLFGLTDEEKQLRAAVKYQERYNAMDQLEKLEAELEEPYTIVKVLKLAELHELLIDIDAFRMLERDASNLRGESKSTILHYWDSLHLVTKDEMKLLQNGGEDSTYGKRLAGIKEIFDGQSKSALTKMQQEIETKLAKSARAPAFDSTGGGDGSVIDRKYWLDVKEQLIVHLAKMDLAELHSKMLVRQLEKLEQRKEELTEKQKETDKADTDDKADEEKGVDSMVPSNVAPDFGNLEEELGLTDEIELSTAAEGGKQYSWQDRYTPRKPRYFNRVKTGYDWNKYNQTHFDSDNPPPKTVQGYKFNIFYPDLVDPTKTPQYILEPADSDDFCILRFRAGPPYEDIAFKIINREWNRSRKRGFRCTFERGVLSLYFNFKTHWYRR